jgi:RNA polymerase sigma-70 factor (ECF subfamily)
MSMEPPSFQEIVSRYDKRLFNTMLAYLGEREEALDVTQEALLAAFRAYAKFRGQSDPFTWLYRIAVNIAKKRFRRRRRREELQVHHQAVGEGAGEVDLRTPEAELLEREKARLLREAISQLPEDQREAIILAYVDQMSYEEIARVQECSLGTVKSRIHRGRLALGRMVDRGQGR